MNVFKHVLVIASRRLLTVLASTLALLFLGTAANAQVINGCIKSNGTLKIADTCSARETPISWNGS